MPKSVEQWRTLVLDFDGVLCDSSRECLLVTWHGAQGHPIETFSRRAVARLPTAYVERFQAYRRFARHLGHFQMALLEELPLITSQEAFEAAYDALDVGRRQAFVDQVQAYRQQVQAQRTQTWLFHHVFYRGVLPWLRRQPTAPWIVSARDPTSIQALLKSHDAHLPPNQVYGSRTDKLEALSAIAKQSQTSREDMLFIDDHPAHVQAACRAGFRAVFASWGYGVLPLKRSAMSPVSSLRLPDLLTGRFPDLSSQTREA
jgi:phosphoglycolate phosphatase-like HAD superfamily hydrolase